MKSVQPRDRECPYEAHAKVHAAASDGGWHFCPICEVVAMTALVLETRQTLTELVLKYEKLATRLLERSDVDAGSARKLRKWMRDVRKILTMNPGRPTNPLARKLVGSPSGRGSSRSKGGRI